MIDNYNPDIFEQLKLEVETLVKGTERSVYKTLCPKIV